LPCILLPVACLSVHLLLDEMVRSAFLVVLEHAQ
jgi:hypothetical protein